VSGRQGSRLDDDRKTAWRLLWRRLRVPWHLLHARRRLAAFHARERSLEEAVDAAMNLGMVVLEIGTAFGGTLFIWSQLAFAKVIACDLARPRECQDCVAAALVGEPVDFLFIDGDHSFEGVSADYAGATSGSSSAWSFRPPRSRRSSFLRVGA
jgi:hypothetical protein